MRGTQVHFEGEVGGGDGLRREWFDVVMREMLSPARGLFLSKDGGRTLHPNPHSEVQPPPPPAAARPRTNMLTSHRDIGIICMHGPAGRRLQLAWS